MARIFIPTIIRDPHATAVALALERKGHEVVLWYGADFPTLQEGSIFLSQEDGLSWEASGPELDIRDAHFDVVWFRRPSMAVLPESLHNGDRHVAKRACDSYLRAFWNIIAPSAFWVNPLESRTLANSKPVQLREALHSGLKIPRSLFSNDPRRIREFLTRHEGRVVFKTHRPATWSSGENVAKALTNNVTLDDLPDDDVLRLSSGIFQEKIEKAYELRVHYFGNFSIGAKISVKEDPMGEIVDWRGAYDALEVDHAPPLPEAVDRSCREFMRRLGIVFGCFDFIVTRGEEYIFLEVNEMGQFLWIENINPEILVLDPFCEFLIHGSREFEWRSSKDSVHFSDIQEEAYKVNEEASTLHVQNESLHRVKE